LAAAPIPFFACLFHFLSGAQELAYLDSEIERIHAKVANIEQIQKRESALLAPLKNPDPHYLDKYVETLHFLLPEIKKLETLQAEISTTSSSPNGFSCYNPTITTSLFLKTKSDPMTSSKK